MKARKNGKGKNRRSRNSGAQPRNIPQLLLYPHSMVALDPKGASAAATALQRGPGGGRRAMRIFVVNQFAAQAAPDPPETRRFSPPAAIGDPATAFEDMVVRLLVGPPSERDSYWNDSARRLLASMIMGARAKGDGKR